MLGLTIKSNDLVGAEEALPCQGYDNWKQRNNFHSDWEHILLLLYGTNVSNYKVTSLAPPVLKHYTPFFFSKTCSGKSTNIWIYSSWNSVTVISKLDPFWKTELLTISILKVHPLTITLFLETTCVSENKLTERVDKDSYCLTWMQIILKFHQQAVRYSQIHNKSGRCVGKNSIISPSVSLPHKINGSTIFPGVTIALK